ncbi:helix-turn-helix domain-containing protein [Clostridium paraputrificum]|uniref:helix-turn-helix domain-containing protein n=1 Tax=Clostridium paraputrificum TaxID=29363 RepID=UPI003D32AF7C
MFLFEDIAKDFFNCTSIPIIVLNKRFELIFNYGHIKESLSLFNKENIIQKVKNSKENDKIFNIKCEDNIVFSIATLFTRCQIPLIFILGPLTLGIDLNKKEIPYLRNECCIDYLRDFLILIAKDKFMSINCEYTYSPFVLSAIKHIHTHYDEEIDMESLCSKFNINKSYFCTIFKKETGLTFINFLNNFRVEQSKEMLKNTNYSLLDIALATGFKNQSYYSTTFKKITGESPIEYRKRGT